MPFREKTAWISLFCLVATFGLFFGLLSQGRLGPTGMHHLHWFLHALMAFVVLQLVLHLIARVTTPLDAKAPLDERERIILLKASRNAYIALFIGAISVPLSLHLPGHLHANTPSAPWIALLGLFASEVVRAISQIVYFRRGR
jgi:hypothetical protein